MADKPIREQSALELLETHAKALEAENTRLARELEIQKQAQNAITNSLCAERDRLRAKLTLVKDLLQEGSPREALRQLKLVLADSSPVETPIARPKYSGPHASYHCPCDDPACPGKRLYDPAIDDRPAVETTEHPVCANCGATYWAHSKARGTCPGVVGTYRPAVEMGACNHHFSELLASKGDAFETRQCLECAKIFRVRLPEKAAARQRQD